MDALLTQQEELAAKIYQLQTNFRKDGEQRKTKNYLEKKIDVLKTTYGEYVVTDDKILKTVPPLEKSHPYLTSRQTTQEIYKKLIDEMRDRLHNGPPRTPTPSMSSDNLDLPSLTHPINNVSEDDAKNINQSSGVSVTLIKLYKKQDVLMRQMYRKLRAINDALDAHSYSNEYLSLKTRQLEREMEEITTLHTTILIDTEEDEQTTDYFKYDFYETLLLKVENMIISLKQKGSGLVESSTTVQLPKVEIPSFYGEYERWSAFNDIFTELIHQNKTLSNVVKMTYLKSKLQKGAAQLINHLATTGENYEMAWATLQARYNNPRLLANSYFNSLLSLSTLQVASAQAVRAMHDTTKEMMHNLQQLNINSTFEAFVVFILTKKLDPDSTQLYETTLQNPKGVPKLEDFFNFLERRFQSLEAMGNTRTSIPRTQVIQPLRRVNAATISTPCWVPQCKENHKMESCNLFKKMPTLERAKLVNSANLCPRCITRHQKDKCPATTWCLVCNGKHNTLLHCNNSASRTEATAKTFVVNQQSPVLLPTAVVKAATSTGQLVTLRALIDPGSQATLISAKAAKQFNFIRQKAYIKISGIGGREAGICRQVIKTKISPRGEGNFALNIEAMVFENLNHQLPEIDVDITKWTHLHKIQLADPLFNQSQPIDLILGADYYPSIVNNNIIKGGPEDPMAQETELGWIVIGNMGSIDCQQKTTMITTKGIEEQLKLLVECDNIPEERSRNEEEVKAEDYFSSTLEREPDGRYKVRLPFKDDHVQLGESRKRATARLLQLERKFKNDAPFKQLYHKFMEEYLSLNHMELVNEADENIPVENSYYIPHHAIFKQDSTTTKLRVVFDASARTTTGVSLNDVIMTGPKIQEDLPDIILRWRKHKYVMTADIEKMYRQVWLNEVDRNYQRILWRTDPATRIKAYRLNTVTYGTTSASFLAVRALLQVAEEARKSYPKAAEIITTDFYVDDLLTGGDTIEENLSILGDLTTITKQGGFNLRKWSSNHEDILKNIPSEMQGIGNVQIKLNDCIKTLGILYNPKEDVFEFDVSKLHIAAGQSTKRSLLAESSKLFDPVGWLSPITIATKILMQETWMSGIGWDEKLPQKINNKWLKYKNELCEIGNIKIPRWINTTKSIQTELHGFADASEYAYAAVVYCKTTDEIGQITTSLVMAKTRVAPIKIKLSVPRLELKAALLLAKLLNYVQLVMRLNNYKTYAWTDSMITLCWIKGDPNRYKTFVANRISAIKQILPTATWHHIRSQENPADIASRGVTPSELVNDNLWWHGPPILHCMPLHWKSLDEWKFEELMGNETEHKQYLQEETKKKLVLVNIVNKDTCWRELVEKISNYDKLQRIVANCTRFINNAARNISTLKGVQADIIILKLCQEEDFKAEIRCLKQAKNLDKSSKLLSLNPVLDENGLLRVKGRLLNSDLPTTTKYPIILGKNNLITRKLIEKAHKVMLHGGTQLTLTHLRNKYWILDGRRAVRSVIERCVICFRHKQNNTKQFMGDLPAARVRPGRPFAKTGIDYAGPIMIRTTKGRGHKAYKGYIALFICMVTKALHIEIVSSLTTEGFIAAYKRFTSRRGLCTDMYSDNGSCFIGANSQMKKNYYTAITSLPVEIANIIALDETTWHFIPPFTPHFGGLWEAGIKSVKFHLKRVIGETTLTFEELYTVTTQVEACLNSRPLTPLTNDPSDLKALTPGHFLIGDSIKAQPTPDSDYLSLKTRWQLVEKMVQDFWKRWSVEYLHSMQQRTKWKSIQPNLTINDLVLIKDEQQPATRWKLGRIIDTHSGKDGLIRVATVKCQEATYKRPIVKLCKLPIEENLKDSIDASSNAARITISDDTSSSGQRNNFPSRRQPHRQAKVSIRGSHLALAMLSILSVLGLVQANIEVLPFNHSAGIYFEEVGNLEVVAMKWTIVIYYKLKPYWEEINTFKQAQLQIQEACNDLPELNCNVILQQLHWQWNNLLAENELLMASNKERRRLRRGLGDTTGIILGDMFGILTKREADEYEAQFERINQNENHLLALVQNQTSVIDNTVRLIKHNSNITMTSVNNLRADQQRLRQEITLLNEYRSREERVRSVLLSVIELMLILKNLEETQQSLLDVVSDAHRKMLHPTILTPVQLEDQIYLIRQHIPASITIPGLNIHDFMHVYQSMGVRSRVTHQNVIIEIVIPLAFSIEYTLLAVLAVPDITQGNTQYHVVTSTEYIAVDNHREHFAFLSSDELNRCQKFQPDRCLCEISPIFNALTNNGRCEIAVLQRKTELEKVCEFRPTRSTNHWIKLHAPNQWIFVVPNETTVDVICGSKIDSYNFQGSGVVNIKAGCMLRDKEFTIIAVGVTSNNISKSFHKSAHLLTTRNMKNFSLEFKREESKEIKANATASLDTAAIEAEIATLRDNEHLPNEGLHHVHHYTMIHLIFWSLLCLGIVWIIMFVRRNRAAQKPIPLRPPESSSV